MVSRSSVVSLGHLESYLPDSRSSDSEPRPIMKTSDSYDPEKWPELKAILRWIGRWALAGLSILLVYRYPVLMVIPLAVWLVSAIWASFHTGPDQLPGPGAEGD